MEHMKVIASSYGDLFDREPEPVLTENARRVLEKRYLKKDDRGKVIETPKELFARVAWNLAQAEGLYGGDDAKVRDTALKFFRLIADLEFLPNSPTLMNAGLDLQQLSACFAAGTPISTAAGPKPIEEVAVGDMVLTHRGRYRPVLALARREGSVFKVKIHRLPPMFATADHPFLTPNGWVRTIDLEGTYVRVGGPAEQVTRTHIEFEGELVYEGKNGRSEASAARHRVSGTRSLQISPVRARIELDEEIGWFFGMYLAEGEINPELRALRFTLGLHEESVANRLVGILRDRFALEADVVHVVNAPTSWLTVRVHSKILCEWIAREFGRGFARKKLPAWGPASPREFKVALLRGVADADGTRVNVNQTRITLSNEGLIRQLFELAVGMDLTPCMKPEYMPDAATARPWSITLGGQPMYVRDGAYLAKSVEPVPGVTTVFNLEVEEDNTYVANGVVVHNCFVLPVDDSLAGIFQTLKESALIHQSGGGTGYSFSRLRPKNDFVKSTMGVASGPVSFMRVYDAATQQVKQGSKRRGANMGILRIDHPDILDFITCKDKTTEITNFNISVAVTDEFMEALKTGTKYDLVNPRTKQAVRQLDARDVLDKIAFQAWKNGEPGLFFIDENNRRQPTPNIGDMEATNPCGEQPLLPYESCNLGSIDLDRHTVCGRDGRYDVDWKKLERSIRMSVRLLDDVIDMNAYPVKQIEEMTKATRKIGLGVMGFARMLFKLEVPYDSSEGVEWGRRIMKYIQETAYDESRKLSEERGVYPAWEGSRHQEKGIRLRNSYVTTVAPTGTLSMIADTSSGCEPEFSLIWYKRVMEGEQLPYFLDYFEEVAKREGFWRDDLVQKILANRGSPRGLKEVPEKWQRVFGVAYNVSPDWHVRMQAAFQDWCDAAVSKCITGDSWIFTDRGMLRIGSLYRGEAPDTFANRNLQVASNPGVVAAREYYYGGVQPVVRVSTDLGLELGGTPVHRVKAVERGRVDWKKMASIRPGDRLLVEYGYGLFGNEHEFAKVYDGPFQYNRKTNSKDVRIPYKITRDLARVFGFLVADGGWTTNSMYLTNEDDAILEDFRATVTRRFGTRVGTVADRRTARTRTAHANSREIVSFLRDYVRMSNRAEAKSVPEIVLRSGREVQREFIRGLTLDGYVRADGRLVPLTTTSKDLAVQVQMMLLNLGIPAVLSSKRIHYRYKDEANRKREFYEVAIVSDWRRAFVETIGFPEVRKQRAARERLRVPQDTRHGIPADIDDLESLAVEKGRIVRSQRLREQLRGISQRARAGRELSREHLLWFLDITRDLADRPAWKRLSALVHRPFVYARVKGISYGKEEVHDFHVPSNNTFVANGFVSHNTINMPPEATVEDVKKAYLLAYELKCKGITVYREGSREDQVLNVGVPEAPKAIESPDAKAVHVPVPTEPAVTRPRPRPDVITGRTQKLLTGYGALYVTINEDERGLFEVFAQTGRGGGYTASFTEGIARLVSLCLRSGVPVDEIIDQLEGIRSPRIALDHSERVYSIPDAIAKAIKRHIGMQKSGVVPAVETFDETGPGPEAVETDVELEKEARDVEEMVKKGLNPECPECGKQLVFEEGCVKCRACGYSEC
jgi:adenosylcobalamin-dependent ribonucleoside-diphosphate reductase